MNASQITTRAAAPASPLDGVPDDWAVFPSQGTQAGGEAS
jgi:hypothetical protein